MLILRRKAGETLLIGDNVEIEILETANWGVKVGIRAPKEVSILRKELKITRDANCAAARDVRVADLPASLQIFSSVNSYKPPAPR